MLEREMMNLLDVCYDKALQGVLPVEKSIEELAEDYLAKTNSREKAIDKLIGYQTVLCGTNGFITGLGGLLVLPVAISANVAGVIYVQLRMIAAIAHINGYDIYSDQVRTIAYACLTGSSAANILKNVGIKISEKMAVNALKKVPGAILIKINQQVGFRLVTKFGQKGLVNVIKMMPLVGGVVGGVFDTGMTLTIGNIAKKVFSE
ncbi:EcsC family protein [Leptotrichia sp. oral taxon 498]|uniref:EcsC family protein n=1 Tax=Leptotrichia sp. oral taxon 498 TaxID=712368 RepID=UPI000B8CC2AE|nr:EcsC family protein [Leptotrichia sp. oral taxon 498]ASQ48603.1 EcsC family protein [Leptotrichia sp. oral taxon 498]